jgi:hypothetical protein
VATPSPNPIPPAGTGTVTANYVGAAGPKCFNVIFSNAARTKCCTLKICVTLPPCTPSLTGDCLIKDFYVCEGKKTKVTFYINNPTVLPQCYNWSMSAVAMPGCVTLLPSVFSAASGSTISIGPGGTLAICVLLNTSSLTPGNCAGFQVCISRKGPTPPVVTCCRSILRCPKLTDPCIVIKDPHTVISPGKTVGIPIIIKNPTTSVITQSFTVRDDLGILTFGRRASTDAFITGVDSAMINDISDEHPVEFSVAPGETREVMIYATYTGRALIGIPIDTIIIGQPCVSVPIDTPIDWTSGTIPISGGVTAGTGGISTGGIGIKDHWRNLSAQTTAGGVSLALEHVTNPGQLYRLEESTDLLQWTSQEPPAVSGVVMEDNGAFWGTGATVRTSPAPRAGQPKRYFRLAEQ